MLKNKIFFFIFLMIPFTSIIASRDINKLKKNFVRPNLIPHPEENPYTQEKEDLGRRLFFDRQLSKGKKIFCGSCHVPIKAWEDYLSLSMGEAQKRLKRATPSIMNLAWSDKFFWDGRVKSLEDQIRGPITDHKEMNLTFEELIKRLKDDLDYPSLFKKAFPKEEINKQTISKALATFIRGIVSFKAPFDHWIEGKEDAISPSAKRGFLVFNNKGKCVQCHSGWRFTDDKFHDVGLVTDDIGRGLIDPSYPYAFKTPSLREISKRNPYMHDSSIATLSDAIDFFDRGGDVERRGKSLKPLNLTKKEKKDLLEFLYSLFSLKKENIPQSIHNELYLGRERSRKY